MSGAIGAGPGTAEPLDLALALGDDALVLAQRMGEWVASAPELEEDVALVNIGLDLLGQARALLTYAGSADGRSEDDLAYLRDPHELRNVRLVELSDHGDFGRCIARLLVFSAYQAELYARLAHADDKTLAAVAAKAVKEVAYHRDHATQWVLRLGDGTDESHRRMQAGLDWAWPYVAELFEGEAADLRDAALAYVEDVIERATLTVPLVEPDAGGGRRGEHTPALTELLAELQVLGRAMPGVTW